MALRECAIHKKWARHYEKGQVFDVDGNWIKGVNDTHGTHVTGTVGANRDGNGMHGVAWGLIFI